MRERIDYNAKIGMFNDLYYVEKREDNYALIHLYDHGNVKAGAEVAPNSRAVMINRKTYAKARIIAVLLEGKISDKNITGGKYDSNGCKLARQQYKEYCEQNKDAIKEYCEQNKDAISEWSKEYYKKNKDAISEQNKEYYKRNKEAISEQNKEYYKRNKEAIKERSKEYYKRNKEAISERSKEYYKRKKEKKRLIGGI